MTSVYDERIASIPDEEASHDSKQYGIYNLSNGRTVYSKSSSNLYNRTFSSWSIKVKIIKLENKYEVWFLNPDPSFG